MKLIKWKIWIFNIILMFYSKNNENVNLLTILMDKNFLWKTYENKTLKSWNFLGPECVLLIYISFKLREFLVSFCQLRFFRKNTRLFFCIAKFSFFALEQVTMIHGNTKCIDLCFMKWGHESNRERFRT